MIEPSKFTGWVEHIFPAGQYGQEIVLRDYKDDSDRPKYPIALKFRVGTKCDCNISNLGIGDKVAVQYYLSGKSGIGKNGYYCIVSLNIAKVNGLTVIERAPEPEKIDSVSSEEEEELPF